MEILLVIGLVLILSFGFVVAFGAPYVPTLKLQRSQALDMLDLRPGQVLIELGSGDGAMLVEAAKRGIKSIGYELNPLLVIVSKFRTRRYKKLIEVKWKNFWNEDISNADGVYVFLVSRLMGKLEKKIINEAKPGLKIVSYGFEMPSLITKKTKNALHMYQLSVTRQKPSK